MSKAILVVDMPKECDECPCFRIGTIYDICQAEQKTKYYYDDGIPDWCPLREAPEKKEELNILGYSTGWNDCIDEILGGSGE